MRVKTVILVIGVVMYATSSPNPVSTVLCVMTPPPSVFRLYHTKCWYPIVDEIRIRDNDGTILKKQCF